MRLAALALALALALAGRPAAACPTDLRSDLVPLPVYATLPNEGSTFGVMPVIVRVCPEDHRTESIFAPSVTWNSVIRWTGSFRWFYYPNEYTTLTLVASASTRINYNNLLLWQRLPTAKGASTDELLLRIQRNVFERFFGIGPFTPPSAESSYTSLRFIANARLGFNLAAHLNLGATLAFEHDQVESIGVPGLPLATLSFPQAPGMHGASLLAQGVEIRYDDRRGGDYAERGARVSAGGAYVEGLEGSPGFLRLGMEARVIWPELASLSGAARAYWSAVTSREAPFYQQSSLGGSLLLRGFTENRFTDQQAWTLELEQRLRVLRTNILGVITDWRVDPFVAVGQVFSGLDDIIARPRVSVGIGFRAFVRPNVVGRVDIAYAGEGVKVYVDIGYPF